MLLLVPTEDEEIVNEAKDIRNSLKNFMHETFEKSWLRKRFPWGGRRNGKVAQRRNDTRFAIDLLGRFPLDGNLCTSQGLRKRLNFHITHKVR